jgi:hypothetical protein
MTDMAATAGTQQQNELELEIAAFMGPHIKRARIFLVLLGGLYAFMGYRAYGDVAALRDLARGETGEFARMATLLYAAVVFTIVAGVANIVLAVVAGKKTMIAFYAAVGIFAANSLFQIYLAGPLLFTSWVWWVTLIILGMGFQAAYKADKLRKSGGRPAL